MGAKFPIVAVISALDQATGPLRSIGRRAASAFNSTFSKGATALTAFSAGIGRATVGMAKLGAAAGALGAGALGAGLHSIAERADAIGETALKLGVTTEALQEWRWAAKIGGVEAETFEKALQKMSIGMANARAKTGPLAKLLEEMPSAFRAQVLATKDNDEALTLWLAALNKIPDAGKRSALAVKVFGKAGQDMALMADKSAEEIAALRAEARSFGLVTDDGAAAAGDFLDALDRLKLSAAGLGATIGSSLFPVLRPLIEGLTGWVAANRELVAARVADWVTSAGEALARIDWSTIGAAVHYLKAGFGGLADVLSGAEGTWAAAAVGLAALGAVIAANPIAAATVGFVALAGVIKEHWEPIKAWFSALWTRLRTIFGAAVDWMGDAWEAVWGGIKSVFTGVLEFFGIHLGALADVFTWGIGLAVKAIELLAPDWLKAAWSGIGDWFGDLWDGVVGVFGWAYKAILGWVDKIMGLVDSAINAVSDLTGSIDPETRHRQKLQGSSVVESMRALERLSPALEEQTRRLEYAMTVGGSLDIRVAGPAGTRVTGLETANPQVPLRVNFATGRRAIGATP